MPWHRQTLRQSQGWVMSERAPHLFSREEWAAMSEHDRELVAEARRREVEEAKRHHPAGRRALLDSLTVERFSHGHG
jgi:hypothetical protein